MKLLKKKLFKLATIVPLVSVSTFALNACSYSGSKIYLANFENYMSTDLIDELKQEYRNFSLKSFATNEDLERKFSRNYDMAISSTYLIAKLANSGQLEEIQWERFGLNQLDENGNVLMENGKPKPITNAEEALTLFDDKTRKILTGGIYNLDKVGGNSGGGLLRFCVPYFLQDFVFSYKNLEPFNFENKDNIEWTDIIKFASKNTGPSKKINRIAMIDDYRSIYSIPRLMQTKNTENPTVNPGDPNSVNDENIKYDIQTFKDTYSLLYKDFPQVNSFLLNSDSNLILNNIVDEEGSDAAILYNGDALYSFQSGDNIPEAKFDTWLKSHFHNEQFDFRVVRPNNTLIALDAMIINKNSKSNREDMYSIIKKIVLEGADLSLYNSGTKEYNTEGIIKQENEEYIYGPMKNFDFIQYTSPLKNISTYVQNVTFNDSQGIKSYFEEKYVYLKDDGILTENEYVSYIKSLIEVYSIKKDATVNNTLEQNLSDINKSNMYHAFNSIRKRL